MSKRPPPFAERPSPSNQVLENAILAFRMQRLEEAERLASEVLKSNRGDGGAAQQRSDDRNPAGRRTSRRRTERCGVGTIAPHDSTAAAIPAGVHRTRR